LLCGFEWDSQTAWLLFALFPVSAAWLLAYLALLTLFLSLDRSVCVAVWLPTCLPVCSLVVFTSEQSSIHSGGGIITYVDKQAQQQHLSYMAGPPAS
jgi:hypothetical protein